MRQLFAVVLLAISVSDAQAIMIYMVAGFDELRPPEDHPQVKQYRSELDEFHQWIKQHDMDHLERLFGPPNGVDYHELYDRPISEYRGVTLSGFHHKGQERRHVFFSIGDVGGISVWSSWDGISTDAALVYLKKDLGYQKLTEKNLYRRLAWDRRRFRELVQVAVERHQKHAVPGAAALGSWYLSDGEQIKNLAKEPPPDPLAQDEEEPVFGVLRTRDLLAAGGVVLVGLISAGYCGWLRYRRHARKREGTTDSRQVT